MGQEAGLRALCGVLHRVPTLNTFKWVNYTKKLKISFFLKIILKTAKLPSRKQTAESMNPHAWFLGHTQVMNWLSDLLTDELWIFDTVELWIFRHWRRQILSPRQRLLIVLPGHALLCKRGRGPVTSVTAAFCIGISFTAFRSYCFVPAVLFESGYYSGIPNLWYSNSSRATLVIVSDHTVC